MNFAEEVEVVTAYGHELIRATHRTTFEITKDEDLTPRGDCIIAVKADKSVVDLSRRFRELARKPNAEITIIIECEGEKEIVKASGDPRLTYTHMRDLVVRKSTYICDRTLAIGADGAASDFPRSIVSKLRDEKAKGLLVVRAYV